MKRLKEDLSKKYTSLDHKINVVYTPRTFGMYFQEMLQIKKYCGSIVYKQGFDALIIIQRDSVQALLYRTPYLASSTKFYFSYKIPGRFGEIFEEVLQNILQLASLLYQE